MEGRAGATEPRSNDEIRADLIKRHDPRDAMGWNRRTARLVADVPALLAQHERDTAMIERLCKRAAGFEDLWHEAEAERDAARVRADELQAMFEGKP